MRTALAFLRRDWLVWTSYRAAMFQHYLGVVLLVLLVYVLGSNFAGDLSPESPLLQPPEGVEIPPHSGDYVAFALIGLALTDMFMSGLTGVPKALRNAQYSGTLETMLLSPIRNHEFLIGSGMFSFMQSLARAFLLLTFGYLVLGFWKQANLGLMPLVFIPGLLCFVALGLFSASFILILKQGDPISLGYAAVSTILGGTLFPTNALPGWLQPVVFLLPLSHALAGMRLAFAGAPIAAAMPQILILWAFALVLLPSAFLFFRMAMRRARRKGSLGYY